MIHYHGMPLSGPQQKVSCFLSGRHAFVSHANPECLPIVAECCQSFALDNGAFSAWKKGKQVDWNGYYEWVNEWRDHPGFDFAIIPDVIDGTEKENDDLVLHWSTNGLGECGVPVWHFHESINRLTALCGAWPRVALGSSGEWPTPGARRWWERVNEFMERITIKGRPQTKLHGLRMLDPEIFSRMPLASADSTNAARNCAFDSKFKTYAPVETWQRAENIARIVEASNSASHWTPIDVQGDLFTA